MKSKKGLMIISILLLVLTFALCTVSFAATNYTPNEFKGQINTSASGTTNVKTTGGKIVGLIRVVGTIAAVGMLIVLGIKYMVGSAEERAEYKKTMVPYIVGAVLIFASTTLVGVIYDLSMSLNNGSGSSGSSSVVRTTPDFTRGGHVDP